jgi:[NiFe] hydrogenase small subunit
MNQNPRHKRQAPGIKRRGFLKLCAATAAILGMPAGQIAASLTSEERPPLIYLNFAGCTGCTEALLRAQDPDFAALIFDVLNVVYLETLMAAFGADSEAVLDEAVEEYEGEFICVVEGALPTGANGGFGLLGGRTFVEVAEHVLPKAKYVVSLGTCAVFGGLPAAGANITDAKSIAEATGIETINISGCPPHPMNLVALVAGYLINGQLPPMREDGRPEFIHGQTVHSRCTTPNGCLHGYKCNGPQSFNTCPVQPYNEESFCIQAGHFCIGCSEDGFWDKNAPFYTPDFSTAFAAFRSRVEDHIAPQQAGCTPCHSESYFQTFEGALGERNFQLGMHDLHGFVDIKKGQSCNLCHLPPSGFKKVK